MEAELVEPMVMPWVVVLSVPIPMVWAKAPVPILTVVALVEPMAIVPVEAAWIDTAVPVPPWIRVVEPVALVEPMVTLSVAVAALPIVIVLVAPEVVLALPMLMA